MVINIVPNPPSELEAAACTHGIPARSEDGATPEQRSMNAVAEQMRMVSMKTDSIHAGFVGEETALDPVHDAGTCKSAENSAEIKCIAKDICEHLRDELIMGHNDEEGDRKVKDTHDRDKDTRDL